MLKDTLDTGSWLGSVQEWQIYSALCDLWQADASQNWVMVGACQKGLQSPMKRGIIGSQVLSAAVLKRDPFPAFDVLGGGFMSAAWADSESSLWMSGGLARPDPQNAAKCTASLWKYELGKSDSGAWTHVTRPKAAAKLPEQNLEPWPVAKCGAQVWRPYELTTTAESHLTTALTHPSEHWDLIGGSASPLLPTAPVDGEAPAAQSCKTGTREVTAAETPGICTSRLSCDELGQLYSGAWRTCNGCDIDHPKYAYSYRGSSQVCGESDNGMDSLADNGTAGRTRWSDGPNPEG